MGLKIFEKNYKKNETNKYYNHYHIILIIKYALTDLHLIRLYNNKTLHRQEKKRLEHENILHIFRVNLIITAYKVSTHGGGLQRPPRAL